jgi:acid phosphatase
MSLSDKIVQPVETRRLYPPRLQLEHVQIYFRHGDRTPTTPRFTKAGFPVYWPLCFSDRQQMPATSSPHSTGWVSLDLNGEKNPYGIEKGIQGPGICGFGELTDRGRQSAFSLGQSLRSLYVDRLRFLPDTISDSGTIYLRSTQYQRTFGSLQQVFKGLYPPQNRDSTLRDLKAFVRHPTEETLLPNEDHCPRLIQLLKEFTQKTAQKCELDS